MNMTHKGFHQRRTYSRREMPAIPKSCSNRAIFQFHLASSSKMLLGAELRCMIGSVFDLVHTPTGNRSLLHQRRAIMVLWTIIVRQYWCLVHPVALSYSGALSGNAQSSVISEDFQAHIVAGNGLARLLMLTRTVIEAPASRWGERCLRFWLGYYIDFFLGAHATSKPTQGHKFSGLSQ